jgi:hypothetical protein
MARLAPVRRRSRQGTPLQSKHAGEIAICMQAESASHPYVPIACSLPTLITSAVFDRHVRPIGLLAERGARREARRPTRCTATHRVCLAAAPPSSIDLLHPMERPHGRRGHIKARLQPVRRYRPFRRLSLMPTQYPSLLQSCDGCLEAYIPMSTHTTKAILQSLCLMLARCLTSIPSEAGHCGCSSTHRLLLVLFNAAHVLLH